MRSDIFYTGVRNGRGVNVRSSWPEKPIVRSESGDSCSSQARPIQVAHAGKRFENPREPLLLPNIQASGAKAELCAGCFIRLSETRLLFTVGG
jgi:hypothetical protein